MNKNKSNNTTNTTTKNTTKKLTQDHFIDDHFSLPHQDYHVFVDKYNNPYSCMLNFVDIRNNSNKFYKIQLIQNNHTLSDFKLYTRYGRVGEKGMPSHIPTQSTHEAISEFYSKYRQKTGNNWGDPNFIVKNGKYQRMKLADINVDNLEEDPQNNTQDVTQNNLTEISHKKCATIINNSNLQYNTINTSQNNKILPKLESSIIELLELLSNKKTFSSVLKTFNIDSEKMPLGKISEEQVDNAHKILTTISRLVSSIENGECNESCELLNLNKSIIDDYIIDLSSSFWSIVPYSCKRNQPPIINNSDFINKLVDLLDIIRNMEITGKITKKFSSINDMYNDMHIEISSYIEPNERKFIENFVYKTHTPTHNFKLEILDIFRLKKHTNTILNTTNTNTAINTTNTNTALNTINDTTDNITSEDIFNKIEDHRLLVHGSRMANFMGILSSGLRLPNPSQVCNGSILGKGIYFADMVSKSANYCCMDETDNIGFILLCEVALGNKPDLQQSVCYLNLLPRYTSRWGLGKITMDDNSYVKFSTDDDFLKNVKIPQGPLKNRDGMSHYASFQYNEYVIFNPNNYRFKYLVKLKKTA